MDEQLLEQIARLPCWSASVEVSPLVGGMTNRNFLVRDRQGQRFVVRVGHDLPEHGVMRFNELAAARAGHAAGISPEVTYAASGIMVSRFIEGLTLTPDDVRKTANLDRIVELLHRCHHGIPRFLRGPALIFWVFQAIRNYIGLLSEPDKNRLQLPLAELRAIADQLEAEVGPVTIVFGHNDLLAANFIDDGKRLWLVDWDYAGFNSPLFDLANLASNNFLDAELEERLLVAYYTGATDRACRRGFHAMKCASLLRELLWAAVSEVRSTIDYDYASYAYDYLARFESLRSGGA